jgi:hypothetical protein
MPGAKRRNSWHGIGGWFSRRHPLPVRPTQPCERTIREWRMQNPQLPRVRRLVQIFLSHVPWRETVDSPRKLTAGAPVDRKLRLVTTLRFRVRPSKPEDGDWGELDQEDARENTCSLAHGFRRLSSYTTATNEKLRIGSLYSRLWLKLCVLTPGGHGHAGKAMPCCSASHFLRCISVSRTRMSCR